MLPVRLHHGMAGPGGNYAAGSEVHCAEVIARYLVSTRQAVPVGWEYTADDSPSEALGDESASETTDEPISFESATVPRKARKKG